MNAHVVKLLNMSIGELTNCGILKETEPTVEECVRFGDAGLAVIRYQQLYDADITEAYDAVIKMKNNLKR